MKKMLCGWTCAPFDGRPCLLPPARNGRFVTLARPSCKFLWAPTPPFAYATHMDGMVGHATLQVNHRGNPAAGPDLPAEAIGFGASVPKVGQTSQLCGGSAAGNPRMGAMPQGFRSPVASALQPLADRSFAESVFENSL